jgi:beta-glucosidase
VQGATSVPSGIGRAASWDSKLEKEIGEIVGRQERAVGITKAFAPDISRVSRMGRQGFTVNPIIKKTNRRGKHDY